MLLLALLQTAHAFDSNPQPIRVEGSADLFNNLEYSTGVLPAGSPIAVELALQTNGGASVSMDGNANLSWPEAFQLSMDPTAGTGIYTLDATVDAVANVYVDIDIAGVITYSDTFPFTLASLPLVGDATFDPWALGQRVETTSDIASYDLIDQSWSPISGLELQFTASAAPTLVGGYETVRWSADDVVVTDPGADARLAPDRVSDYDVDALFTGLWDARLGLALRPAVSACVDIIFYSDCFELAAFDIPVDLVGDTVEQDFPVQELSFPLPMLASDTVSADFGDVEPGSVANVQVPFTNEGSLLVEGAVEVRGGEGAFTVYPTTLSAGPGVETGVMVSFAPTTEGAASAELVVTSNDPTMPEYVIPLSGNGYVEPEESTDGGNDLADTEKADVSSCGCATGGNAGTTLPGALALAVGAVLAARRRRGGAAS